MIRRTFGRRPATWKIRFLHTFPVTILLLRTLVCAYLSVFYEIKTVYRRVGGEGNNKIVFELINDVCIRTNVGRNAVRATRERRGPPPPPLDGFLM